MHTGARLDVLVCASSVHGNPHSIGQGKGGLQEVCKAELLVDGKALSGSMADLPMMPKHEADFCPSEPSGGGKVLENLPTEARGGKQLDAEESVFQYRGESSSVSPDIGC